MEKIEITQAEYDTLITDSIFLTCLNNAGVDNWEGFNVALDIFNEMKSEEE